MRADSAAPGARDPGTAASSTASLDTGSSERGVAIITQPETPVTVVADMTVGARYITDVRAACVSDIRRLVQDQSERLLKCTLDIGEKLTQLREQCRADSRLWTSLFPTSGADASDEKKLPFSRATAHKLMAIYRNETLRVSHAKHQLPADWESLYQLSRVPANRLSSVLDGDQIGAHSTRSEVRRIANSLDPKNASVYRTTQPVETAEERVERQLDRMKEAWKGASEAARTQFVRMKVKPNSAPPSQEPGTTVEEAIKALITQTGTKYSSAISAVRMSRSRITKLQNQLIEAKNELARAEAAVMKAAREIRT